MSDQFKKSKKKFFSSCHDIIILKSVDHSTKDSVISFPPIYCRFGYSDILSISLTKKQEIKMYINDKYCESIMNLALDEKGLLYFKKNINKKRDVKGIDIEMDSPNDITERDGLSSTNVLESSQDSKHDSDEMKSLHSPLHISNSHSDSNKKSPRLQSVLYQLNKIKQTLSLQKQKEFYARTPSEKQIRSIADLLHFGVNSIRFELKRKYFPSAVVSCNAYVWSPETPILVFDIYGTITRQGIVPRNVPVVRSSIVKMLRYLKFVAGYNIVYISLSPLNDISEMRHLLKACPPGPIVLKTERILDHFIVQLKDNLKGTLKENSSWDNLSDLVKNKKDKKDKFDKLDNKDKLNDSKDNSKIESNPRKEKLIGSSNKQNVLSMIDELWQLHRRKYKRQILEQVVSEAETLPSEAEMNNSNHRLFRWGILKTKSKKQTQNLTNIALEQSMDDTLFLNIPPSKPRIIAGFGNDYSEIKKLSMANIETLFKIKNKRSIFVYDARKYDKAVFKCVSANNIPDINFNEDQDFLKFSHQSFRLNGLHPETNISPLTFNLLSQIFEYIPFDGSKEMGVKSQKMHLASVCQTWKHIIQLRFKSYLIEIFAQKIGLSLDDLSSHPHLFKFLSNNYIHKKVIPWRHRLKNEHGDIVLRFNSKEMTFDELLSFFLMDYDREQGMPTDKIVIDEEYRMLNAVYTYRGITTKPDLKKVDIEGFDIESNEDALTKFVEENNILTLDKKDPKEWDYENVLAIKIERGKKGIRNRGDHTWLQLWSSEGYIFSFGVYRESFDAKLQLGDVRTPDDGEFYVCRGGEHAILPLKCTRRQLGEILKSNLIHVRDRDVVYSLTLYNCTDYVLDQYVSQLGIYFHTRFNLINHALGNETWDNISSIATKRFPTTLAKVATNTTIMLAPNIYLSLISAQKSNELKKRLMKEDYQDIVDHNGNLFFLDTDSKTRIKYLKLRLVDGQVDRVSSPWKLGQIMDAIHLERKARNDRWYVPSKYIKKSSHQENEKTTQHTPLRSVSSSENLVEAEEIQKSQRSEES